MHAAELCLLHCHLAVHHPCQRRHWGVRVAQPHHRRALRRRQRHRDGAGLLPASDHHLHPWCTKLLSWYDHGSRINLPSCNRASQCGSMCSSSSYWRHNPPNHWLALPPSPPAPPSANNIIVPPPSTDNVFFVVTVRVWIVIRKLPLRVAGSAGTDNDVVRGLLVRGLAATRIVAWQRE